LTCEENSKIQIFNFYALKYYIKYIMVLHCNHCTSFYLHLEIAKKIILRFIDLLGEHAVQGGHLGLDDYEGDDAADGQLENQHYPVMARKKDVMTF